MAVSYYNYGTTTSTDNKCTACYATSSGTTGNLGYSSASSTLWPFMRPKTYIVLAPSHWTTQDALAFVEVINVQTKTGFMIDLLIKGDVIITDPCIDKRSLAEMLPILNLHASRNDWAIIEMFFEERPLEQA